MASGLSFPVGFKNGTNGGLQVAVNAMRAAQVPQRFLGINEDGISCVVRTKGNPHVHMVLRGGLSGPNYELSAVSKAEEIIVDAKMKPRIVVDCSHANSGKDHNRQERVLDNVLGQLRDGSRAVFGAMVESYLEAGNQPIPDDPSKLRYGVSITDKCVDWHTTERMIRAAHKILGWIRTRTASVQDS
jgi:3-deoxy-7-phosphoheptulonate synthase